jgi:hypothetical protein
MINFEVLPQLLLEGRIFREQASRSSSSNSQGDSNGVDHLFLKVVKKIPRFNFSSAHNSDRELLPATMALKRI